MSDDIPKSKVTDPAIKADFLNGKTIGFPFKGVIIAINAQEHLENPDVPVVINFSQERNCVRGSANVRTMGAHVLNGLDSKGYLVGEKRIHGKSHYAVQPPKGKDAGSVYEDCYSCIFNAAEHASLVGNPRKPERNCNTR